MLEIVILFKYMIEKEYISLKEFAEIVGVKVRTVRDWIDKGVVQTYQLVPKGKHFIKKLDIPTFLRKEKNGRN